MSNKEKSDYVLTHALFSTFSSSESWSILSDIERSIKAKIETVGVPLKDWDIQINYGIKTGFNDAFIIDSAKRNEILNACQSEEERRRTAELIRPILRGRDIKRYGYDWANLWLINTHNGICGEVERIHIEDYPTIKQHLDYYWDKIETRADKGDTPYNLRNCAYVDGYWEPNLFQFFSRVYPKIRQALPVPFKMEGVVRIDYTPAHKALREAIVNCLVHASYGLIHNIVIERYPDRLVFCNPGTMLIPVEKFFAGGTSICRNSYLQKMFGFIGYVERAGSGADTILQGWKENNWPKPQIRELYDPDQVELTLYFKSLDTRDEPKPDTNDDTNKMTPTSTSIAVAVKVSLSTVKRELDKMKDMGVIRRVGPTFGGHWEIIKK